MAHSSSRTHTTVALLDDAPGTSRLEEATLTRAALESRFNDAQPLAVPGFFRRAVVVIGDLFAAVGIGLCIPLVILAIGVPIALCVRLLLWIGGLL